MVSVILHVMTLNNHYSLVGITSLGLSYNGDLYKDKGSTMNSNPAYLASQQWTVGFRFLACPAFFFHYDSDSGIY